MKASAIIAALQERIAEGGDLSCEVFVDTREAGSFRPVREIASSEYAIIFSTVLPEHFDRPVCDLPRSIGQVVSDIAKRLNVKRGSEIDPPDASAKEKNHD